VKNTFKEHLTQNPDTHYYSIAFSREAASKVWILWQTACHILGTCQNAFDMVHICTR